MSCTVNLLGQTDAEDAVQEALVRAWKAADTLRDGETVRGWLLTITANLCHDWLRGRHGTRVRLTASLQDPSDETPELVASTDNDPGVECRYAAD